MDKKRPVWHRGELQLQQHAGVAEHMAEVGQRVVRDYMPDQHRTFFAQLPFVVVGSVDADGNAWATLLEGPPGFLSSPVPEALDIRAHLHTGDPAAAGFQPGAAIGLLGIELHTRRRNRLNGVLSAHNGDLRLRVEQSFGNCPRYIPLRDAHFERDPTLPFVGETEVLATLDPAARALIAAAETFYVATYAEQQVDVSHRGGKAGFVRVDEDGLLTIPDFNGNLFFSTLGNILLNGQAGLLWTDDATGDVLQMTGDAEVILDAPEIAAFEGAERLWTFRARRIVRRRAALALRWTARSEGTSPEVLLTGDWQTARDRVRAAAQASAWRRYTVTRIVDESPTIRSFHLQPSDGADLLPHLAGQHLPIRVTLPGDSKPTIRTYTLSVAPADGFYRISVKREGAVSQYLHQHLATGDSLEARAPAGTFTLDTTTSRPTVLLAAGVGITPMLAMLRHALLADPHQPRPLYLLQAARTRDELAFSAEISTLLAHSSTGKHWRILSQPGEARQGIDFDWAGRIDMALLTQVLPFNDYDFYLCGPAQFTQMLYDGLRAYNIADHRIHAEAFGPSSLQRTAETATDAAPPLPAARDAVPIRFMGSLKEARWTPESGSLLALAEARGLSPEYGCRAGHCGTCKTPLLKGKVTYLSPPSASVAEDEVLLCCAQPAAQGNEEEGIWLGL